MNKVLFEVRNRFNRFPYGFSNPLEGSFRQTHRTKLLWAGFFSASAIAYFPLKSALRAETEPFPLNKERVVTTEEIQELRIHLYGDSERPEFADSLFECKQGKNGAWTVIRRKRPPPFSVAIPLCDGSGQLSIEMTVGAEFLRQALEEKMVIGGLKQIPDLVLGAGCIGQVYKIAMPDGKEGVLKVYNFQMGAREAERFHPIRLGGKTKPLSSDQMISSLSKSMAIIRNSRSFKKSPHYAEAYGLVYIKEWNVWAVAYEYLEGTYPSNYSHNREQGKKIFASMAEGMRLLDQQGSPVTDLKNSNILIRKDGLAMFFDDLYSNIEQSNEESSFSKVMFGSFMYDALRPLSNRNVIEESMDQIHHCFGPRFLKMQEQISPEMAELVCFCWKQSISWDGIIQALS